MLFLVLCFSESHAQYSLSSEGWYGLADWWKSISHEAVYTNGGSGVELWET